MYVYPGAASSRVRLRRITAHHATAVEIGGVLGDRALHHLDPRSVAAIVIHRQHHLFELVVQQARIAIRHSGSIADRPAGDILDAALDPPAVEHREGGDTVECGFMPPVPEASDGRRGG